MRSIKTALFLVCNFIIFGIAFSYAQTVYVTDEFEVTMRTGPSNENKIIAMLPTGTKLQVIEEKGDWVLVQSPTGSEGWVVKRYASAETPKKIIAEQLKKKYDVALKDLEMETEKALTFEKENKELRVALSTSQKKLDRVKQDYTSLINESKDFLELKKEHTKNFANLRKSTSELEQLRKENAELHSSTNIIWFLSGAAVVIVSWLIGYVMGKLKRRSQSHSLYR
jgi:SH3 domain protein